MFRAFLVAGVLLCFLGAPMARADRDAVTFETGDSTPVPAAKENPPGGVGIEKETRMIAAFMGAFFIHLSYKHAKRYADRTLEGCNDAYAKWDAFSMAQNALISIGAFTFCGVPWSAYGEKETPGEAPIPSVFYRAALRVAVNELGMTYEEGVLWASRRNTNVDAVERWLARIHTAHQHAVYVLRYSPQAARAYAEREAGSP